MKNIFAEHSEQESLYITAYGFEDISPNAHWGKGSRNKYILHYVLSGEGYFNGVRIREGQGFYIRAGIPHSYHSSDDKPWKYFWVVFHGREANNVCQKYIYTDEHGIFSYDFKSELQNFCDRFFSAYKRISAAKATGIFWLLLSCHEKEQKVSGNNYVAKAKIYMEQNCHRPLRISEVSDVLHLSVRYLYNLFIKHAGLPPKTFLNNLKLQRACHMLKSNAMSITEIAVSVGFEDVLTFSRFFKKNMHLSPSAFRKKQLLHDHL